MRGGYLTVRVYVLCYENQFDISTVDCRDTTDNHRTGKRSERKMTGKDKRRKD